MKRLLSIFLLLFVFSVSAYGSPQGFKEVMWGEKLSQRSDMVIVMPPKVADNISLFERKSDEGAIGPIKTENISYVAFNDKFYQVTIQTKGRSNFTGIGQILVNNYKNLDPVNRQCVANSEYVYIRFKDSLVEITGSYDKITDIGNILIENQPIKAEATRYFNDQLKKVKL